MEGYVQRALWKELHIDPFVECFKTATLEKSYWYKLSVPEKIYLRIAFLPTFCW